VSASIVLLDGALGCGLALQRTISTIAIISSYAGNARGSDSCAGNTYTAMPVVHSASAPKYACLGMSTNSVPDEGSGASEQTLAVSVS
jgi:hypothetical protein